MDIMLPMFCCERCGKQLLRKTRNQRYCADCSPIAKIENAKAYRARRKAEEGPVPRPVLPGGRKKKDEAKPAVSYVPSTAESLKGSVFDLTGKSLNRVSKEAHALSLSYGEYVSMVQAGTIRKFLRSERGIADPDGTLRRLVGGGKR